MRYWQVKIRYWQVNCHWLNVKRTFNKVFKFIKVKKEDNTLGDYAMIIEDERDLCHLLGIVLRKNNVPSSCVFSIKEARESIKRIKPSIIFLDNHLPDGTGLDFIQQAKAIYPAAKIIMITAHDSPAEIDEAFHNGADYFISKPFNSFNIKTSLEFLTSQKKGKIYSHV